MTHSPRIWSVAGAKCKVSDRDCGYKINFRYQKSSCKSGHKQHPFAVGVKQNNTAGRDMGLIIPCHLTKMIPKLRGLPKGHFIRSQGLCGSRSWAGLGWEWDGSTGPPEDVDLAQDGPRWLHSHPGMSAGVSGWFGSAEPPLSLCGLFSRVVML